MSELLPIHPLAELFPALEGEAFDALVADIRQHGVREEIVLLGGAILDGRNRYRACLMAEVEPRFINFDGPLAPMMFAGLDPLAWVLSKNLHRRHLTESQRAMVAAKLATLGEGRPSQTAQIQAVSQSDAADMLKVSRASVQTARLVHDRGVPQLASAVEAGNIAVSAASLIAVRPKSEQVDIVAGGPESLAAAAKRLRDEKTAEKKARRQEVEQRLGARQRALPERRYGVILADPEWRFEPYSRESGMDRAPENHYPTSDVETIAGRDVISIAADDAVLFLWATAPMLPEALYVMGRWGFAYKTHLVWMKDVQGLGYWARSLHELLLIGVRGKVPAPAPGTQWQSVIAAPRGRHSEKPDNFHRLIESYFPTLPKIELNARVARAGWDVWGNEVEAA